MSEAFQQGCFSPFSLDNVQKSLGPVLESAETKLQSVLDCLTSAGELSQKEILRMQLELSKITSIGLLLSAIVKEITDSVKAAIQKIG